MAQYTPGPWKATPDGEGYKITHRDTFVVGHAIAFVRPSHSANEEQCEANARLIAAAPDLLEALKLHVAYEALPIDRGGPNGPKGTAWSAFIAARDASIARASGAT